MNKRSKRKLRALKFMKYIFLIYGVISFIFSIYTYSNIYNFEKNGVETTATIVSIITTTSGDETYTDVTIEYFVEGEKYINKLNWYSSTMEEGQDIPILYLPNNPNKFINQKNRYFMFWMTLGAGIVFIITSIIFILIVKNKKRKLDAGEIDEYKPVEIKKTTSTNYVLLSLPIFGVFYAIIRMVFLIGKHFDAQWSVFGKQYWKCWFSCTLIMLSSALLCSPLFLAYNYILETNNWGLIYSFAYVVYLIMGYGVYFLTNFVIKKIKPFGEEKKTSELSEILNKIDYE